jgi:L-lactate dehydrogenase complex protein LldG
MSNGNEFLRRVKAAAEQGRQYRVDLKPIPDAVGYVGAGDDLCARLAEEVNAVGGQAFAVSDLKAAGEQLQRLLAEEDVASAVCWRHEVLDRLNLRERLAAAGVERFDRDRLALLSTAEQRQVLLACDVGITSCDCAIAETGTLMMVARPGQERVASLLPPMHIAVVERRQIVPDLIDAFDLLREQGLDQLASNVTFITGPSKTGDIELQLTTGVHGPGKWRVIVVEDGGIAIPR